MFSVGVVDEFYHDIALLVLLKRKMHMIDLFDCFIGISPCLDLFNSMLLRIIAVCLTLCSSLKNRRSNLLWLCRQYRVSLPFCRFWLTRLVILIKGIHKFHKNYKSAAREREKKTKAMDNMYFHDSMKNR